MRIAEALRLIHAAPPEAPVFRVGLACGFTPLHLQTLLHGRLQQALPSRRVSIETGLFGDLPGNVSRAAVTKPNAVAVIIEWADLDPRLGFRSAGAWGPEATHDIRDSISASLDRLTQAIGEIPEGTRVVITLPVLPLPPLFPPGCAQSSRSEMLLDERILQFASSLAERPNLAVVNHRAFMADAAFPSRYDHKSDLLTGFPFTLPFTDCLTVHLSRLLAPPPPKKGIITDLDDTLWHGILGEIGADQVDWSLTGHHHPHGLYQKLLAALAEEGVLVGVATKNDPQVVEKALARPDLLIPPNHLFPVEAHWQAKSGSVARILRSWNIAADSVVFIDDSPMELAEVAAAHPGITCLAFPKTDPAACLELLRQLRDLCGKERLTREDLLRLESIRANTQFQREASTGNAPEAFLAQANATITIDFAPSPDDSRVLELVNKTNQFNLNGIRRSDADWRLSLQQPGAVAAVLSYEDKFGPLGKISVIRGRIEGTTLFVDTWVLSCRAFSRRIEYHCLRSLFDRWSLAEICFDYISTAKNGPVREFFEVFSDEQTPGAYRLTPLQFRDRCPPLYATVAIP